MSDEKGDITKCQHGDCLRDALVYLKTEVNGTATAAHYLCDEHAEKVRNSPLGRVEILADEQLAESEVTARE